MVQVCKEGGYWLVNFLILFLEERNEHARPMHRCIKMLMTSSKMNLKSSANKRRKNTDCTTAGQTIGRKPETQHVFATFHPGKD